MRRNHGTCRISRFIPVIKTGVTRRERPEINRTPALMAHKTDSNTVLWSVDLAWRICSSTPGKLSQMQKSI